MKSLPEIVRANAVDALLLDTVQFYAELGPMQLGMPYVHVANGLHWDYSGYTPLCVYGWPHEITPAALARNPGRCRKVGWFVPERQRRHQSTCGERWAKNRLERSLLHYFSLGVNRPNSQGLRLRKFALACAVLSHRSISQWQRARESAFPLGAVNGGASYLRFDGDDFERPSRCFPHHRSCRRKE